MAGSFRDLIVYKKAYALAMEIFEITKKFPSEKKYKLTDQTRRSSRADMENTETQVSLDFAETCKYISQEEYRELRNKSEEVGRMLNHMV
ncbi:MAG: four helix bundle protein, partial [Bacteroidetes bacterium]|nr:four helix bundle protein [Bacteroidota bacterium]